MTCPKCSSENKVKSGKMNGKQRYQCKDCGCNFTQSSRFRTPRETRLECIKLYLEGVGFRGIARLTGVSHVSVQNWVRELGDQIEKVREEKQETQVDQEHVSVMEIDKMWHFVQKKRTNVGSGSHTIAMDAKSTRSN